MARFTLNIYGEDDAIVKTYETDKIRYGVLVKALEINEGKKEMSDAEFIKSANAIVKALFKGLTDDELENAEITDVISTYRQIVNLSGKINGSKKN